MPVANYGISRPAPVPQGFSVKDMGGLDEVEVKSIVQQELDGALGQDGGQLSAERLQAQRYYAGELPEAIGEGRSSVVMRSVLEAVQWVLPALIRIFTASDEICRVEPGRPAAMPPPMPPPMPQPMPQPMAPPMMAPGMPGQPPGMPQGMPPMPMPMPMPMRPPPPDPVVLAKQATAYLNFIFYRDNPGFMILHDWFLDALTEKLGWVKYWYDTQEEAVTNSYFGITREQYDALLGQADNVEVVKEETFEQGVDDFNLDRPFPQPVPMTLYDCTLRVTRKHGRCHIANVAPEEVLFSRRAKRDDIPFLAHRRRWTVSDLVQQGYDEDTLDEVPMDDSMEWNSERTQRYQPNEEPYTAYQRGDAAKQIWVEESYVRLAKDGESTTELYKVMTAGHGLIILTKDGEPCIEPVDEVPFVSICPIPASHALVGMSLADLTMDLQEIKSSIIRQMVDNAYLSNWPRVEVGDDSVNENTYDDLLTLRPGGIVRTKRIGGLQSMSIPYTADKSFPLVQYIDQTQEIRTGVARNNQMISVDALQNTTASGIAMAQQAQAQRVELFARIFAHGVERLMRGVMSLVRRHQQQERIIRVTGAWLTIDPKQWRDEMPVTVSVGLGTGNRDQILAHLMTVVQLQGNIVQQQGGPAGPLVYPSNVYDALKQLQENAGFSGSPFFHDPAMPPPPGAAPPGQKPPDPAAMQAQAVVQATQLKAQAAVAAVQMKAQADAQSSTQKAGLEAQLAQQKQQHQMQLEAQRQAHEMDLEQQKAQHDLVIARAKVEAEAAVKAREVELKFAAGAYAAGGGPGPAVGNGGLSL